MRIYVNYVKSSKILRNTHLSFKTHLTATLTYKNGVMVQNEGDIRDQHIQLPLHAHFQKVFSN